MHIRYWGQGGINPRYFCPGEFDQGGNYCQSLLERRWNDKLRAVNEVKERIEMERVKRNELTREDIRCITTLSDRLPEVWRHPDTDPVIKKRIIRTVVEEVVIHLDSDKIVRSSPLQKAAVAPFALYFHSPPPPNFNQLSGIDSPVNVESYFQDFLPLDLSAVPGTGR